MDSRVQFVMILVLVAFSAVLLYAADPGECDLYPPCPFHLVTGLYCPGCGSLRALHTLLHGHIAGALRLNPLAVAALPFLGYSLMAYGARAWRKDAPPRRHSQPAWIWLLLIGIIAFWMGRNMPFPPFPLLAP